MQIGTEQKEFIIDLAMTPAPVAMEILDDAKDECLTTEGVLYLEGC